ncbi:MAG: hypothetical protein ABI456_05445 [Ktedonobacteraceae bacterium]
MSNHPIERPRSFPGRLGTVLCVWFLSGMFLSMLLSGIYSVAGLLLPPLFFFLSGTIYLAGGLLGGLWSRESLRRRELSRTDVIVTLFVLLLSVSFLFLSIVFVIIGFRRL